MFFKKMGHLYQVERIKKQIKKTILIQKKAE